MKKELKVLISLSVVLLMVIGLILPLKSTQCVLSDSNSSVVNIVSEDLDRWIRENESLYYKDISVKSTPIESKIQPSSISYVIFDVNVQQMLKAQSPYELPVIQGMMNCLNSKKQYLKQFQIDYANRKLGDQLKELREYIGRAEELNAVFKVEFYVDTKGNIDQNSIKFYTQTPDGDTFLDASILQSGTPEDLQRQGFKRMEKIIEESGQNGLLSTTSSYYDAYDRITAGDYADTWTSNPPYDAWDDTHGYPPDPNDQYDPNSGAWWDTTHWNNEQYTLSRYFASDCADYVSQALHAGGIPMDTIYDTNHWWYDNSKPVSSYDNCPWVYVPELRNYMVSHGYFYPSTFDSANKGCVAIEKHNNHVVMITQNDTINRALSAHTTDRKHYWYSGSKINEDRTPGSDHSDYYETNYDFYEVHYWVHLTS